MNTEAIMTNFLLGTLLHKTSVPTDFHEQASSVEQMLKDDVTGMIDTLTDFAVQSADVDFSVESDNKTLTAIFKKWSHSVNSAYKGRIPSGINALAKEYFTERWKGASFPVLKVAKWEKVGDLLLPTKMYFVDGSCIYAKAKDEDDTLCLSSYDYYLGEDAKPARKLEKNAIFARPYGRWFDEYPTPYLIKRGVYHNYLLYKSLKNQQAKILDQIIPYLMYIKKGGAFSNGQIQSYSNEQLTTVIEEMKNLVAQMKTDSLGEVATRAVNFDEEFQQLIPDIGTMFQPELFTTLEQGILGGLGFIDVADSVSNSRKESTLNPKAFVEEVRSGVKGYKQVLNELMLLIQEKNSKNKKYMNSEFYITSSPVRAFMTDKFKTHIRQMYDRGRVSTRTAVELIAEVDFETEVHRREIETKRDIEKIMYPQITRNDEGKAKDFTGKDPKKEEDKNGQDIDEDKKGKEAEEFDLSSAEDLEGAIYSNVESLPDSVNKNMTKDLQYVFMSVFNRAHELYNDESRAFKVSWRTIKNIGRKNRAGLWQRKKKREKGKLIPVKLSKVILETALGQVEKEILNETMSQLKIDNAKKQGELLSKLLEKKTENTDKKG